MTRHTIHLHSALALSDAGEPPEWVQLVPAGTFRGVDGRGPYTANPQAILHNSQLPAVLDEMHATDLAGPQGGEARARGWIVELADRGAEGVWGRVEWTPSGRLLMSERAYRGISPALAVAKKGGVVLAILRASLTNTPNLTLKPILNSTQGQPTMDMMDFLRQLLGLEPDADDTAIRSALQAVMGDRTMQSQALAAVRSALSLPADAAAATLATTLHARLADAGRAGELSTQVTALQSQVTALEDAGRRAVATAAVDAAIGAGKGAINAQRERYITLHMQDAAATQAMMDAIPSLHSGGLPARSGPAPDAQLSADDEAVIALMGVDAESYRKQRAAGPALVEVI